MFVGKLILSSSGDYGYVATVWKFRVDHVLGFSTCCSVTFFVSRTWLPWLIFWKQIWKGPCNLHCHLNLCVRVFVSLSSPCFRRGAIWSGNEAANDLLWMWQGWWRQRLLVLLAGMCVCVYEPCCNLSGIVSWFEVTFKQGFEGFSWKTIGDALKNENPKTYMYIDITGLGKPYALIYPKHSAFTVHIHHASYKY